MTIRNKKISQVRFDKNNVDAPTINRALDNVINPLNSWIDDATAAINSLQNATPDPSSITINPENAASVAGNNLNLSGSGGISFASNGSDTITISQQPISVSAQGTAGSGQGNSIAFSGSGGATITRSGTTITISQGTPTITFDVSGSNTISGNTFQLSGSGGIQLTGTAPNTLIVNAAGISPTGPAGGVLGYAGSTYPNPSGLNPPVQNPYGSLIPNKIPIRSYGDGNRTQFIPDQQSTSYNNAGCGIEINGGIGNSSSPFPAPNQVPQAGGEAWVKGGAGSPSIGGDGGAAYLYGGNGVYGGSSFFGFGGNGGFVEIFGGDGNNTTGVGAFAKNGGDVKINGGLRSGPSTAGSDGRVLIANVRGDVIVGTANSTTTISGTLVAPSITGSQITASTNIISPAITGSEISSSNFIGWGNRIVRPYIAACDLTTQTASATTAAYPMTFDTTEEAIGISIVSGSRITFAYDGVYNIQFSAQIDKSSGNAAEVDIWLSETGSNVPRSNTAVHVQGNSAKAVAAWNWVRSFTSGSYAEILWRTDDTDVELLYENSGSSPDRPEIPSVILSVSQV